MNDLDLLSEWERRLSFTDEMWNISLKFLSICYEGDGTYHVKCEFIFPEETYSLFLFIKKFADRNDSQMKSRKMQLISETTYFERCLKGWQLKLQKFDEFEYLLQGLEELNYLLDQRKCVLRALNAKFPGIYSTDENENAIFIICKKDGKSYMSAEWKIMWSNTTQTFEHNVVVEITAKGMNIPDYLRNITSEVMNSPHSKKWWQELFEEIQYLTFENRDDL